MIRPARADDLPTVRAVERAAGALFREVGMDDVADDAGPSLEVLGGYQRDGRAWVALDGDEPGAPAGARVVGFALALEVDGAAHLEQLSVDPTWGRRGHGRRLIDAVAAWGRARGAAAVTLSTFRDVPWNAPYYRRLGFEPLPEDELTPGLLLLRDHERALGLDVAARLFMRRPLA